MRALLQRVDGASVDVGGERIAAIGPGLLVLFGVSSSDDDRTADELAARVAALRIFRDGGGRTNRSLVEVGGSALVVSQFTLYADTSRGRRPGFTDAGPPELAECLYGRFADALRAAGNPGRRTGAVRGRDAGGARQRRAVHDLA